MQEWVGTPRGGGWRRRFRCRVFRAAEDVEDPLLLHTPSCDPQMRLPPLLLLLQLPLFVQPFDPSLLLISARHCWGSRGTATGPPKVNGRPLQIVQCCLVLLLFVLQLRWPLLLPSTALAALSTMLVSSPQQLMLYQTRHELRETEARLVRLSA